MFPLIFDATERNKFYLCNFFKVWKNLGAHNFIPIIEQATLYIFLSRLFYDATRDKDDERRSGSIPEVLQYRASQSQTQVQP